MAQNDHDQSIPVSLFDDDGAAYIGVDLALGQDVSAFMCVCGFQTHSAAAMLQHVKSHATAPPAKVARGQVAECYGLDPWDDPRR